MVDYLIVGAGLAGVCFSEIALNSNKRIVVFENHSQPSSTVAGGMYNPVVLKRFTEIWNAQQQLDIIQEFYPKVERKLGVKFDFPMSLWRKFASVEEQNNWFIASDKLALKNFLNSNLFFNNIEGIQSPYGFGEVLHSGYLDIKSLITNYQDFLEAESMLFRETFQYDLISFHEDFIEYNNIKAKHIIFSEGFGLHLNPFFNDLPLDGTKGELLHIKCPSLQLNKIIKSNIFILPIGKDIYKVGATYNWLDKSNEPTIEGKEELISKLDELVSCEYEIIEHLAGVRPTVKDRRPLVGTHHLNKQLHLLNGLGTRGVMLGPFLAKSLFDYLENGVPLNNEIDIKRYYKKRAN